MIHLRVLGELEIADANGQPLAALVRQQKRVSLLVYLALAAPPGFKRRDTLLALFWPELDESRARAALNKTLHLLRKALGSQVIVSRGDEVGLDRNEIRCDAVDFEELLVEGELDEALALYQGELLPAFYLSDSPEFERWLEDERTRLRERARAAAASLIEYATAAGDIDAATRYARRALEISDDERALRTLISLLDQAGDRAGALREFQRFAHKLETDYGAAPSPETLALIEQVRSRELPVDPIPDLVTPTGSGPTEPPASHSEAVPAQTTPTPEVAITGAPASPASSSPGPRRRPRRFALTAVGAAVLAIVATALFIGTRGNHLDPNLVLVATFENRGGDPALEPLGRIAAEWVAQELAGTQLVDIVDPATAHSATRDLSGNELAGAGPSRHLRDAARRTGAGIVISGSYYRRGDSLRIDAWVTDIARRELIAGVGPFHAAAADPYPALEALHGRVAGALATKLDPRIASIGVLSGPPPRYAAYQAWMNGIEAFGRLNFPIAIGELRRAHSLDSTFVAPLNWIALAYGNLGEWDEVAALLEEISRHRAELGPFDTHFADLVEAWLQGKIPAQYDAARRMVEVAPSSELANFLLAEAALMLDRPSETLEIIARMDPDRLPVDFQAWMATTWTTALHLTGDYEAELELVRHLRAERPGSPLLLNQEVAALAALGRTTELLPLIEATESRAYGAILELKAHGYHEEAREILAHAELLFRNRLAAVPGDAATRQGLALTLYLSGKWEEAEQIFRALAAEAPERLTFTGFVGLLAALRGDREVAEEIAAELARAGGSDRNAGPTFWRARIAAALGERDLAIQLLRLSFDKGNQYIPQTRHTIPEFIMLDEYPELRGPKPDQ